MRFLGEPCRGLLETVILIIVVEGWPVVHKKFVIRLGLQGCIFGGALGTILVFVIGIVFKLIVVAGGIIKRSRGGFFNGLLGLLRIRAAVKIWAEIFGSQFNLNHEIENMTKLEVRGRKTGKATQMCQIGSHCPTTTPSHCRKNSGNHLVLMPFLPQNCGLFCLFVETPTRQ